jgi:hypothetical protein
MSFRWTEAAKAGVAAMYRAGEPEGAIIAAYPGLTRNAIAGEAIREQLHRPPRPQDVRPLAADHPAVVEGRTLFPTRVREADSAPAVLTPGSWQRKLGAVVEKGAWRGFPIYTVTLEERATCPVNCQNWRTCYGNGMQAAWRHRHGPELEDRLQRELAELQLKHPAGFVVRLHALGDFYSVEYVGRWAAWLDQYPALHVFGYTAWERGTAIGAAVALFARCWDRFAIRFSSAPDGLTTGYTLRDRVVTVWENPSPNREQLVCPAQTGRTRGCNTCGICWSPSAREKTIIFIGHGPAKRGPSIRPGKVQIRTKFAPDQLREAVAVHGSQRAAAAALDISLGLLQRGLRA